VAGKQAIDQGYLLTNLNAGSHLTIGKGERLIVIGGWEEFMYKSETYASESLEIWKIGDKCRGY